MHNAVFLLRRAAVGSFVDIIAFLRVNLASLILVLDQYKTRFLKDIVRIH